MADIDLLNAVQSQQTEPSNQDVVDAVHQSQWANTFQNTPPAEVLRSRVNLADTVNRAFDNKLALAARSDAGALNLMQKNAQFQEFQRQAPLREQLLQAHIDATGATNNRIAQEHLARATDTAGFNEEIANGYQNGLVRGTPDFEQAAHRALAKFPHTDQAHIQQVFKAAGEDGEPVNYENMGAEAKASKDALVNAGVPESDIVFKTVKGHVVAQQRTNPLMTDDQKAATAAAVGAARTQTAVDRAKALGALKPEQQQQAVDLLVAKQKALNALKPSAQDRIDFEVAKKSALQGLDPTDQQKITFAVAKKQALDATNPTPQQKIDYDVAHKKALDTLLPSVDEKVALDVARRLALDAMKPTSEQKIAYDVAHKKALNDLAPGNQDALGNEKIEATTRAMINNGLALEFGHLDKTGKSIEPDAGSTQATHVNVRFTGPDGKVHDSGPITIAQYQQLHDQVKGTAATPSTAPVAPAEPGLNTPEEVRAAYRAGALPRDKAEAILKSKFGHK